MLLSSILKKNGMLLFLKFILYLSNAAANHDVIISLRVRLDLTLISSSMFGK